MTTLLEYCEQLSRKLDYDEPSTLQGTIDDEHTRMVDDINRAYKLIWNKINKKNEDAETSGTITLVAGIEAYSFPAGMLTIEQVRQSDQAVPITLVPWPEYEKYKYGISTVVDVGQPAFASIFNRQLYIYPVPDTAGTLNVRGKQGFTALSADASEPDLQDEFHDPIFELAYYYQMVYEGDPASELQYRNYKESLAAAKSNMKSSRRRMSRIIGPHEQSRLNWIREQTR
jgi:hypothetical protein